MCALAELNAHPEGALLGKAVLGFGTPPIPRSCARAIQAKSAEGSPLTPGLCSSGPDSCCIALPRSGEANKWLFNDSAIDGSSDV